MHISISRGPSLVLALQIITCCYVTSAAQELVPDRREQEISDALRRVDQLHKTREKLVTLKNILHEIDEEIAANNNKRRACIWKGKIFEECPFTQDVQDYPDYTWQNEQDEIELANMFSAAAGLNNEDSYSYDALSDAYDDMLKPSNHKRAYERKIARDVRNPLCRLGGGNPGSYCHITNPDDVQRQRNFLAGLTAPGKRSVLDSVIAPLSSIVYYKGSVMNEDRLEQRRRGLYILKKLLDEMDKNVIVEQKRVCRFNLGGHCATESAAAVADQWHYLNSAISPGRKRRATSSKNNTEQGSNSVLIKKMMSSKKEE